MVRNRKYAISSMANRTGLQESCVPGGEQAGSELDTVGAESGSQLGSYTARTSDSARDYHFLADGGAHRHS